MIHSIIQAKKKIFLDLSGAIMGLEKLLDM